VTNLSPEANRVRVEFRWYALFTAACSVFLVLVGTVNAVGGFLGDGWLFTVIPIVFGFVGLRGAWLVWAMRNRVAAGHDRLARADEPTRRAADRRARRGTILLFVVFGAISIVGAIVAGFIGFFVAMGATLIALELFGFVAKRLMRRSF
jgi:hypothetical protein